MNSQLRGCVMGGKRRRDAVCVVVAVCSWALMYGSLLAEQPETPFPVPKMTKLPPGPPPFEYVDVGAKIPNYVPSEKWGVQGEPLRKMQKPLPPQESMKRMVVPEGFRVELFAAEPVLQGKPLCMTWDARVRLWI